MNNIQMTEMQKAYYVGREDQTNGITGTHLYMEIMFNGEPELFETALNKVIKAQPFMRAKIDDGMSFKIVDDYEYKVCVTKADPYNQDILTSIRNQLSHKVYTQEDFPLFTISMLGENSRYRIFLSIDMLIADGLSLYEICREIKENLADLNKNQENRLDDLIYMTEYYQQLRTSKRYQKSKDYYLKKLDEILPAPALGYTSTYSNGNFEHLEKTISNSVYKKLSEKAADIDLTGTNILLTAYAYVLAKWSRNSSMSINTTSFIRPKEEKYKTVVGDFTTSMLVQTKIDWNKSFIENAKELQKSLMIAYKNSVFEVPELIREISKKNPGITMPVVFTSMLFDGIELWDEDFFCDYTISQTSQVNLDNQVKKIGDNLNITWDYRRDLFNKDNINNMFSDYISLIQAFAECDDDIAKVFKDSIINDTCDLYKEYNSVAVGQPLTLETSLKEQFIRTVDKYKEKTFIYINGEEYSFNWVYNKAKLLADKITSEMEIRGKKKTRIAFSGNKNIDSFINIFAAILSNNSFCVINEDYGEKKKNETLDQLRNYIYINGNDIISSDDNILLNEDESYILFTSGTTGKPKGIIIYEKAALNTVLTINKMFNVSSDDKLLNISNLYFDLSIYDIFSSMLLGSEIISVNPMFWSQLDEKKANEITIWNSTPALAKEYASKKKLDNLRVFLLSGDFVSVSLVKSLYELYSDNIKINSLGGATEASIWSNYFDCSQPHSKEVIPYGQPLWAQELYVVNSDTGLLCPKEVLGEICISGYGLAAGYLDEEQTNQSFVYHEQLSKRIYYTGDMGYLDNDGNIYIVGRIAQEIKHNGYRIDLREIENYINSIENVSNTIVLIERQSETRTKLSAVVESNDREIDIKIRKYLSSSLPYYMVPSNILVVKKFPLTTNGKVDTTEIRNWLSELETSNEEFTEKQKKLLEVWKRTISDKVYIEITNQDATYFDVGGQSLQAVELRNVIASEYGINISLQELMGNISLRSMSELIEMKKENPANDEFSNKTNDIGELILLRKGTSNKNIVLIHGGTGEINLFLGITNYFDEEYNIYGIRLRYDDSKLAPVIFDFNLFAKAYVKLLEDIENVDILGGWCVGGSIAYEMSLIDPKKYHKLLFINAESPIIDAPVFQGFTVENEIKTLEAYGGIKLNAEEYDSVEMVWQYIFKMFEKNDKLRLGLINALPEALTRILPNLENLDARKTIYQLNRWRGAFEARNHYSKKEKSAAYTIYLNAIDDPMENYLNWNDYFDGIEYIDIPGNHVSLFSEENVAVWCEKLNKKLNIVELEA